MAARKDTETVKLAHGILLDGKYHAPDTDVRVTAQQADDLRAGGYVQGVEAGEVSGGTAAAGT